MAGDPSSIDPDSGTTPEEYLAAVGEDVGGATLRRITDGMTGLTSRQLGDGSTVYSGAVAAGLIAREAGVKGGQPIRVLPFGNVAHDEAANPAAPLQVAVTVGADGVIPPDHRDLGDQRLGMDLHGHLQPPRCALGPGRARGRATPAGPLAGERLKRTPTVVADMRTSCGVAPAFITKADMEMR